MPETFVGCWPGTRIPRSQGNAFTLWRTEPGSVFTKDALFQSNKSGTTRSLVATQVQIKHEKTTGRSRGTVPGISAKSDAGSEEFNRRRAVKKAPTEA